MIWRYLPLAGIVLIIVIGGIVRPLIQLRRHGTLGISLFRRGRAQAVRDVLFALLLAGFIVHTIATARGSAWVHRLVAEGSVPSDMLQVAGALLMVAGTALFAAAQIDLGASWRIGIDPGAAPGLVSRGLYRLCRHPIFSGFLMIFAAYAALLPTLLSLVLLAAGYLLLRAQADAEEVHMLRTYGESYRDYAKRVGRFMPGVGKGMQVKQGSSRRSPNC